MFVSALEIAEDGKQAFATTFGFRGNKGPPSKAEVEAAEKADRAKSVQSRDLAEGMNRRSLPSIPTSGRATPNEYETNQAPNVSSGYLHPESQSAQPSTSEANAEYQARAHPVKFNTDTQRGLHEHGTYEFPRSSEQPHQHFFHDANNHPANKGPHMYSNTGIPQNKHENVTPVHEKSQMSSNVYTSTPVSSPSQGSFGFQTSPLTMRPSGPEKKQPGPWKMEQHVSRSSINEGLTGMETPHIYSPSGQISNQGYFPSSGRMYPTGPSPLSHGERVTPPIRSKIAELEAAMGFSPNHSAHPFQEASVQSFEDSFTGLRERQPVQNYGLAASSPQSKLQRDTSMQSMGDSFTGLRGTSNERSPVFMPTPQRTDMKSNVSIQSFGDSFTGLREASVTPNHTRGGATSNDSLGDSFTGLGLRSNKNTNAQADEDNSFKKEILKPKKITPPVPPKPIIKRKPNSIPEETPMTSIDNVAKGIVKNAVEDSIAKNIVHSTVEEGLAQNLVDKAVKSSVDGTHLNAKETTTDVENEMDVGVGVDSVQRDDSERSENDPVDTSADDTNENPSLLEDESEYHSESNKSSSNDYDEGDEQESDVIVMTSGGEDEAVDDVVDDVLGRAVDSLAVDELVDDIIRVTSNEALASKNEALDDMFDEVVKKSSHETIGIQKGPSNTSSEEEVNV